MPSLILPRRSLLAGVGASLAAPAIVRAQALFRETPFQLASPAATRRRTAS